jgi:hypothetical protein
MMISSLVLVPPQHQQPLFTVPPTLRHRILGLVCIDGIFDLVELLREYPDYVDFVQGAFGDDERVYEQESVTRWVMPATAASKAEEEKEKEEKEKSRNMVRFLVLHSREDDLLSVRQSQLFATHLGKLFSGQGVVDLGDQATHSGEQADVRKVTTTTSSSTSSSGEAAARGEVEVDFESLKGDHYEVLHAAFLPNKIQEWLEAQSI